MRLKGWVATRCIHQAVRSAIALCAFSSHGAAWGDEGDASAPQSAVVDVLREVEGALDELETRLTALRRIAIPSASGVGLMGRDALRVERAIGRAEFHALTREETAAARTLATQRVPPLERSWDARVFALSFTTARASGDARGIVRQCVGLLALATPTEEGLLPCAVALSEGTAPEVPDAMRIGRAVFRSFALHPHVQGASSRLALAIALVPGFVQGGAPEEGLAYLREARLASSAADPWLPRVHFTEALLEYQLGRTDAAVDAWRYLSGEKLGAFRAISLPQERVDPRTRVLALHQVARAFAARGQWPSARDAYARLAGLPETFRSEPLEASSRASAGVFFPERETFPALPSVSVVSERSPLLAEYARAQWMAGDAAGAARAWKASGLPSTPGLLVALARDPSRRVEVALDAARALGEARADARFAREAASSIDPGRTFLGDDSASSGDFAVWSSGATALLALADLHGEDDATREVRRLLTRWRPLLTDTNALWVETAKSVEGLLGPVAFLEQGSLERNEWIAFEVLARHWYGFLRDVRRADVLSSAAWRSGAPLPQSHREELWRRLDAIDDTVASRVRKLEKKALRDNHRGNAARVHALSRAAETLSGALSSLRTLSRVETGRQLAAGTVGALSKKEWDLEIAELERERADIDSELAEISLDHAFLVLSDDDTFPPRADRKAVLDGYARTVKELSTLHRSALAPPESFAAVATRARIVGVWERIESLSEAFRLASDDVVAAAITRRRDFAGEIGEILSQRNAHSRALIAARRASTETFARDVREAAAVLGRYLERREDALLGVLASVSEFNATDASLRSDEINRAQRERAALVEAYRTSIEMGAAR